MQQRMDHYHQRFRVYRLAGTVEAPLLDLDRNF